MPVFDLSLPELHRYSGSNPRPHDFDQYWESAVASLDQVEPNVRLDSVEHPSPIAECFDLTFTGVGGARLYAKYLRPRNFQAPHPGISVFHGYSVASPDWFELVPYVAQGFSVVALDCRGQGGRSEDPGGVHGTTLNGHIVRGLGSSPTDLMYRSVFLDCVQAVRLLMDMPEVDSTRVGAAGASQGGGLTLAAAALEPRIKAAASVYPFLCDYRRVWELDLAENAYGELRQYLRLFDPTHSQVEEMFTTLGYIDVQHLAPRITAQVLMVTGLMDRICPPSTQFAAFNKITSAKEMVIFPDYEHESIPGVNDRILDFFAEAL